MGPSTQPASPHPQPPIPQCESESHVVVAESGPSGASLTEFSLSGRRIRELASQPEQRFIGISSDLEWAASALGIRSLKEGSSWQAMPGSKGWIWPIFVPKSNRLATALWDEKSKTVAGIDLVDYRARKVLRHFEGTSISVAPTDGALFFLEGNSPFEIKRYFRGKVTTMKKIPAVDPDTYYFEVTEVQGLSKNRYVYRISDEHEHRYYDQTGAAFFPGPRKDEPSHREQYDLTFSEDGHYATFTERGWGELTKIVVVDLRSRKRKELPFYGAFPGVHAGHVIFSGDPRLVRPTPENSEFQQISKWALYAVPLGSERLCRVGLFEQPVQIQ